MRFFFDNDALYTETSSIPLQDHTRIDLVLKPGKASTAVRKQTNEQFRVYK